MPTNIQEWSMFVFIVLSTSAIVLGIVVRLARYHIDGRINQNLTHTVQAAVKAEIEPLRLQINNGLTHRQERIEDKVNRLVIHLIDWNGEERRTDGDTQ